MNSVNVERDILKSVVTEVLTENPALLKEILVEIFSEFKLISSKELDDKRVSKLKEMINEDFDKYDEVFKALA